MYEIRIPDSSYFGQVRFDEGDFSSFLKNGLRAMILALMTRSLTSHKGVF
jgi:hypothetical protein